MDEISPPQTPNNVVSPSPDPTAPFPLAPVLLYVSPGQLVETPDPSSSVAQTSGGMMPPPEPSLALSPTPLSPEQLLAILPDNQSHTPMTAFLNFAGSPSNMGHAHNSSVKNYNYQAISVEMLIQTPKLLIDRFRTFLKSMSPAVSFPSPLMLPFEAFSMSSEADVTCYLDCQVVTSAWQAVIRMIPPERTSYDLLSVKQLQTQEAVPDQVFGILKERGSSGRKEFQACAVLEIKSPEIVQGMVTVIKNHLAKKMIDSSDDWISVTRQLRNYAVNTGTRDGIVMDETTAIYFHFPAGGNEDFELHEYLVATIDDPPTVPTDLSLRELVAFMCWRSLLGKGVKFRDFTNCSTKENRASDRASQLPPPAPTKRPNDEHGPGQPKRTRRDPGPSGTTGRQQTMFSGWILNSLVTMDMLPQFPCGYECQLGRKRAPSLDSGFGEPSSSPSHCCRRPRTFHPSAASTEGDKYTAVFRIERIITDTVAMLSTEVAGSKPCFLLAKLFCAHRNAPTLLAKELAVYTACQSLQGNEIPHLYGVWQIIDPLAFSSIVLLTEFIAPGTTIAELRSAALKLSDTSELELARARLRGLEKTGTKAIEELHRHGVMHNDPVGRNLVVCAEEVGGVLQERVVVVDFDVAQVFDEQEMVETRAWQDWAFFRNSFRV